MPLLTRQGNPIGITFGRPSPTIGLEFDINTYRKVGYMVCPVQLRVMAGGDLLGTSDTSITIT